MPHRFGLSSVRGLLDDTRVLVIASAADVRLPDRATYDVAIVVNDAGPVADAAEIPTVGAVLSAIPVIYYPDTPDRPLDPGPRAHREAIRNGVQQWWNTASEAEKRARAEKTWASRRART